MIWNQLEFENGYFRVYPKIFLDWSLHYDFTFTTNLAFGSDPWIWNFKLSKNVSNGYDKTLGKIFQADWFSSHV